MGDIFRLIICLVNFFNCEADIKIFRSVMKGIGIGRF